MKICIRTMYLGKGRNVSLAIDGHMFEIYMYSQNRNPRRLGRRQGSLGMTNQHRPDIGNAAGNWMPLRRKQRLDWGPLDARVGYAEISATAKVKAGDDE